MAHVTAQDHENEKPAVKPFGILEAADTGLRTPLHAFTGDETCFAVIGTPTKRIPNLQQEPYLHTMSVS